MAEAIAVIVALIALFASTSLVRRQLETARLETHLNALLPLMREFRRPDFHDSYNYVVSRLKSEYNHPLGEVGLFDLPEPAQSKAVEQLYFLQDAATLVDLGVIRKQTIIAFLHLRFAHAWEALEPFVLRERARLGMSIAWNVDRMAHDAKKVSEDDLKTYLDELQRRRERPWRTFAGVRSHPSFPSLRKSS